MISMHSEGDTVEVLPFSQSGAYPTLPAAAAFAPASGAATRSCPAVKSRYRGMCRQCCHGYIPAVH